MTLRPSTRLRRLCLALPEAEERETWDIPTYRIRNRIFAMEVEGPRGPAFWCKAPPGAQEILIGADAARFFRPPYLGHKGWVGMSLHGALDWAEVAQLVRRSYSLIAPKQLVARLDGLDRR